MKPKILMYDIEVLPVKALIWGTGKQRIGHEQIIEGEFPIIACIAYKWEHEKKVHVLGFDLKTQNCSKLIKDFTKVIEKADVVLGHNADSYDMKHVNTQRLLAGQDPISWPTTEDTLKQIRKHFRFPSNRLDYIAKVITGEGKSPMNYQDWYNIKIHRCEKAFEKMKKYCARDVRIMSEAYAKLKPFLTPKANRALIQGLDSQSCPSCSSSEVHKHGIVTLRAGRYQKYRCSSCAHIFKGKKV